MPDLVFWSLMVVLLVIALGLARKVVLLTQRLDEVRKKSSSSGSEPISLHDPVTEDIANINKPGNNLGDAPLSDPHHAGSSNMGDAASLLSSRTVDNYLLKKLPETLQTDFEGASDIWLVGASLGTTINEKYSLIENKLKNKTSIKVLLRDPEGETFWMIASHSYTPIAPDQAKSKVQTSLTKLAALREINPKNLEVRVIDHHFSLGMMAFDPDTAKGRIYVEYYPFRMPERSSQPKIVVTPQDGYWFVFYRKQLEMLWENGKSWQSLKA
jgi:hypothetical protein